MIQKNMKLLLVHLSDAHIRHDSDFILKRAERIADAVTNLDDDIKACVVAFTGDIAYSGEASQYGLAEQFLNRLRDDLAKAIGITDITFVFSPGNHDCDFSTPNQVRDILIGSVAKGATTAIGEELVHQSAIVQQEYRNFVQRVKDIPTSFGVSSTLCLVEQVLVDDKCIAFHAYNTAWMSQRNETQGQLFFPTEFMPAEDETPDLVVALFHHPYNWLESNNARAFRQNIERTTDLILTGHEHEAGQYLRLNRTSETTNEYVEGAVLQDAKSGASGFNAVIVDLHNHKQKFFACSWNGLLYETKAIQASWQDFQRNQNRIRNGFIVSQFWTEFLTSPGAGFTNARKDRLELEDIFIEPNLRELTRLDAKSQLVPLNVSGDQFWRRLHDSPYAAILGEEASGKTTLCKRLFGKYHSAGFVPLVLRGAEIKYFDWDRLLKDISSALNTQYSPDVFERYMQLGPEKLVLLIDNYHHIPFNRRGCQELFRHMKKFFGRIVLFTHDLSKVEELSFDGGASNPLLAFTQFEIQEFGHQLREELIERWLSIGQEFNIPETNLDTQVVNTKRLVDAVLGRNLLPSYPIFILIVLQQIEAQTNLNISSGALGYLYESLITNSLSKTAKRLSLDTAYTYLSEIANQMLDLRTRRLSEGQMTEVHRSYCDDYKLALRFEVIEKALVDADILAVHEGWYSFKFKYCYYYFAARHLRDRLTTDEGKERLRHLTEHVYKEEFANILVFLTYLSKDPIVIDEMLRAASSVYPNVEPCDFASHTNFVTSLHDKLPKSVLVDKDSKSTRKEMNQAIDEFESEVKTSEQDADLNDTLRINVAFKTIQILGQILKNFPGSLKGPMKLEIAEQCYFLGLRTTRALLNIMEQNRDGIVEYITECLDADGGDAEARERKARRFASLIVEGISFAVIKKVSGSVGTESLRQTYEEMVDKYRTLPVRLIDLAVKLDHFQQFPEDEFDSLITEVTEKNLFSTLILRHLAFDHFYRFPVPRQIKQKYCAKLGIEMKAVNLLEQKRLHS